MVRRVVAWAVGLVIGLLAILAAWSARPVERPRVSRFVLPVDTRARFNPSVPAISPDGQHTAYTWAPEVAGRCHCTGWRTRRSASRRVRRIVSVLFSGFGLAWVLRRR